MEGWVEVEGMPNVELRKIGHGRIDFGVERIINKHPHADL